jgi:aspartyl-tRNA(Asn)/glutamyl-tRNA(Gln) amidotransferase subunit B
VLVADPVVTNYFESVLAAGAEPRAAAKWVINDVLRVVHEGGWEAFLVSPNALVNLLECVQRGVLSSKMAKDVFSHMAAKGGDPAAIIAELGLQQVTDADEIRAVVLAVMERSPQQLAQFRAGKEKVLGYFVGQVMQATRGRADPKQVNEILLQLLRQA